MIHNEEHPTSKRVSSKSPQKARSPSKKHIKIENSLSYSKNKKSEEVEEQQNATFGERGTPEMFPERTEESQQSSGMRPMKASLVKEAME